MKHVYFYKSIKVGKTLLSPHLVNEIVRKNDNIMYDAQLRR